MRYFLIGVSLLLWGSCVYCSGSAPSLPQNGECQKYWAKRRFTKGTSADFKNTLFRIGGKEPYSDFYRRLDREHCYKEWLVVIYMAANNDLSPYSYRDIWEMESVGSGSSVDVVVFHDTAKNDGLRYYHIAQTPHNINYATLLRSYIQRESLEGLAPDKQEERFLADEGQGLISSPVVEKANGDSGTLETAGAFMKWALTKYPSRRLMLVGWSHSEGFSANPIISPQDLSAQNEMGALGGTRPMSGKQGGFAFNSSTGSHMNVTEMAAGVAELVKEYRGGKPVDILGSDACLNQQVEFGFQWRGIAEYVFGSSTTVQKKGFNYRTLLNWFHQHPLTYTLSLAKQIPLLYGSSVGSGAGREYSSYRDAMATMATWNAAELIFVKNALDAIGAELAEWLAQTPSPLAKIQRQTEMQQLIGQTLRLGGVSNDLHYFLLVLQDWARSKQADADTKTQAMGESLIPLIHSAMDGVTRSVMESYIGPGYQKGLMLTSKGVAVWLPNSEAEYLEMFPQFRQSLFYADETDPRGLSPWGHFIELLYL